MDYTYWHKQTPSRPLFPDLLWSQPENKAQAGKLAIIGGNAHGFAATAEAYAQSVKAGVGASRVLLPDSLQKTIGRVFEAGEYAPSTPSGSFAATALSEALDLCAWADAMLLAGDLGHNSETSILLEKLVEKYQGPLTIAGDALDYFVDKPTSLFARPDTLLVVNFAQLQKLVTAAHCTKAITSNMDLLRLIDVLHEFSEQYHLKLVTKHLDNLIVAVDGEISTTKTTDETTTWQERSAAHGSVWWLQNLSKPFEAITTSLVS